MDNVSTALLKRLQSTSKQLLIHALEHALNETQSESNVLQTIINMQSALELLSKSYVLRREGWRAIIDQRFHSRSESFLLSAITDGTIKTIPFWKSREIASETLYLNEEDKVLLNTFQDRRNQLLHLGYISPPKEILNEAIWFLVRIIHQLEWKESLPVNHQYLTNSLKIFIGDELYFKLMANSCYIAESIDRAYDIYPCEVTYCLECGNESFVKTESDNLVCFVCGFKANTEIIGFTDCPLCEASETVAYDKMNIGNNDSINGKCCRCREFIEVSMCKECGNVFIAGKLCDFCEC